MLSLIGSVAEGYSAFTHFKQGQLGSAVAHSLAAGGQMMIAVPALTRTATHLGAVGMVMATGGMIAGMAIDNP